MSDLVDFGIQNENSDQRAHVCPVVKRVYVYPTVEALKLIKNCAYPKRNAYQPGCKQQTAEGFLVPAKHIPKCIGLEVRNSVWAYIDLKEDQDTTLKGQKAVCLITGMIKKGLYPIPALAEEVKARDLQIDGQDIILKWSRDEQDAHIIQVKCDFKGGPKNLGGTGNLFLQTAERNPKKKH